MNSPQQLENDHLRRQLDQTKRELSEVIDEVVFVERARADAEHRNVASTMRIAALEEELRIVKQQLSTASHYSPSRSSSAQPTGGPADGGGGGGRLYTLQEENAALRGEIAALQAQQLSHTDMTLSAQRATTARVEALARQLHNSESEMENMRRRLHEGGGGGGSASAGGDPNYGRLVAERNAMEQRITALEDLIRRSEADRTTHQNQLLQHANEAIGHSPGSASSSGGGVSAAQLVELRTRIENMARDAASRQAQVEQAIERLRSERGSAAGPTSSSLVDSHPRDFGGASPSGGGGERTRLLAFEKTVQSLNVELASMEQKLKDMEALYQDQQQRFAAARKDFESDQRECDQVVAAMAAELEQLMDDNAKLRQRLRSKSHQSAAAADTQGAGAAATAAAAPPKNAADDEL